jgi:hypothetical protein
MYINKPLPGFCQGKIKKKREKGEKGDRLLFKYYRMKREPLKGKKGTGYFFIYCVGV